eukprot:6994379-Heterocapsa_arctica.AAC.1
MQGSADCPRYLRWIWIRQGRWSSNSIAIAPAGTGATFWRYAGVPARRPPGSWSSQQGLSQCK